MPDYPDTIQLKAIRDWDVMKDPFGLLEYITPLIEEYGTIRITGKYIKKVYITTDGWSGNEDIIRALRENTYLFWSVYWEKSERGGVYTFKVRKLK